MAGEYKPNKLLDKTPYDDGRSTPEYPFVGGSFDDLGRGEYFSNNPDKPDEAFHEKIGYAGNFVSEEANGLKNELNVEVRSYTTGGHSHNSDGQHAVYSQSNINTVAKQDLGLTAGGNTIKGSGEQELGGAAQSTYSVADGGNHYKAASGDVVYTADGDMNFGANGSFCVASGGSRVESVGEEYYLYASGNIDIGGEEKLQVHSTGALTVNTLATMNVISIGAMGIATEATMNVSSTGTMGINSTQPMTVNSAATMNVSSSQSMSVNSPTDITVTCGISNLAMTPSSAKISVGPIASIEMNSGTITIKCGASVIVMTAGGIEIATPSLTAQSLGGAIINSAGPMTVTSESEGVFAAAGSVQLASGGTAAVFAPVVLIG